MKILLCTFHKKLFLFISAELGDYDPRRHSNGYVSEFRLIANQSKELENRVMELHQQLKGMSPSAAELNYLEKVKWNDMYGVDLHPVLVNCFADFKLILQTVKLISYRVVTRLHIHSGTHTLIQYFCTTIQKVLYGIVKIIYGERRHLKLILKFVCAIQN